MYMRKGGTEMDEMKRAIGNIEMRPEAKARMLENLKAASGEGKRRRYRARPALLNRAAAFVGVLCLVGILSFPARALVQSILEERMAAVPTEELEDMNAMLHEQGTDAYGFTREFTAAEEQRLTELEVQYRQGLFPEGELLRVKTAGDAVEDAVCYVEDTGEYVFPDRELTDEELLQYLDFQETLKFALAENSEEQQEEQPSREDFIGENKASLLAADWLMKLYGKSTAGLETNAYLFFENGRDEVVEFPAWETVKHPNQYMVYYGTMHDHYYFRIDALTGELAGVSHSWAKMDKDAVAEEELETALKECRREAESVLREKLDVDADFVDVQEWKRGNEEGDISVFEYHFVTGDGTGYLVKMHGSDRTFRDYFVTDYETYKEEVMP